MKTITMFEVGEDVLIRAKITDILVEHGEIKYKIKAEHSNNDLDHNFTEHQIIQYEKPVEENAEEEDETKSEKDVQ